MSWNIFDLVIFLSIVGIAQAWFESCDHKYQLTTNNPQTLLQSPYYPNKYPAGTSCRYLITAPQDYKISVSCDIDMYSTSSGACASENLYISTEGDLTFAGSKFYCGTGKITTQSLFRQVAFAYTSDQSYTNGRFSCTLTLIAPTASNCECGWYNGAKIVGGTEARVNEFPCVVALVYNNGVFCTGEIVSHRWIISAAHCFYKTIYNSPNAITVRAGEHDIRTTAESKYTVYYSVSRIVIHPQYNEDTDANDIAMIQTAAEMEWSLGVGPCCLPYYNQFTDFTGTNVKLPGWGTTQFTGPKSPVLLVTNVKIASANQCAATYPQYTSNHICTVSQTGADSCQFDSGGPVLYTTTRLFCIGIISLGKSCGEPNVPALNTKVVNYIPWIESNVGFAMCKKQ